jgi:hypothetical protein
MRYGPKDEYNYKKTYNKESFKQTRRQRKTDKNPQVLPTYFRVELTIMTKPKTECTVFRGTEIREEVTAEVVLQADSWSTRYLARFTSKGLLQEAKDLRGGNKILATKARFENRHKREGRELRVTEFNRLS